MATQLIATVTHKQKDYCLWKCRQTDNNTCPEHNNLPPTRAYLNTPRLSLFGIQFTLPLLNQAKMNARARMHTSLSFIPKIHEGKSLSSSPSLSFPSTLRGTVPSSVPARPLKSFWILWQTIFPSLRTPHPLFSLASAQSGGASPPTPPLICITWENPGGNTCFLHIYIYLFIYIHIYKKDGLHVEIFKEFRTKLASIVFKLVFEVAQQQLEATWTLSISALCHRSA